MTGDPVSIRLGLPAPLGVVLAVLESLAATAPEARVRYEGSDLVVVFVEPDENEPAVSYEAPT